MNSNPLDGTFDGALEAVELSQIDSRLNSASTLFTIDHHQDFDSVFKAMQQVLPVCGSLLLLFLNMAFLDQLLITFFVQIAFMSVVSVLEPLPQEVELNKANNDFNMQSCKSIKVGGVPSYLCLAHSTLSFSSWSK